MNSINNFSLPAHSVVESRNLSAPEQAVIVDLQRKTVTFENCHESREFHAAGVPPSYVCSFDDIVSVRDFLVGDHHGLPFRILFFFSHVPINDLRSLFVTTSTGRCRIFADWSGFHDVRIALKQIPMEGKRIPWTDDWRFVLIFLLGIFAIVAGIIYLLL